MDLAIRGSGFFQMTKDHSPPIYTRSGHFQLDSEGYVVNDAQMRLMGHPATEAGVIDRSGRSVPMKLSTSTLPPRATDSVTVWFNLNSLDRATGSAATPGIDFSDAETYNAATSLTTYDIRGQPVALTLYFQRRDDAGATPGSIVWNVFATANSWPVGGSPAAPVTTLEYPADGRAPVASSGMVTLAQIVAGPTAHGAPTVPLTNVILNLANSTQFGMHFTVTDTQQSGTPPGWLLSVSFEPDGMLMGTYSNKRTAPVGQLELASFGDLQCLQALGNTWITTRSCGEPLVGTPGSASFGTVQPGALEVF